MNASEGFVLLARPFTQTEGLSRGNGYGWLIRNECVLFRASEGGGTETVHCSVEERIASFSYRQGWRM